VLDANGQELDVEEWLVDPGIEIPEVATKVHGISTAKAQAEGIAASEAILQIVEKLRSLNSQMPLVAFNAPFDFTILQNEAIRYGFDPLVPDPVVDPLVIDRELRFGPGKRNLLILCSLYGVQLSAAHNSTADAVAAGRLAQAQAGRYPKLNLDSSELHKLQVGWSDKWTRNLHDWLEKEDRPVDRAEIGWPVRAS
jgi:DNA polymerase-3 subunit epsilon